MFGSLWSKFLDWFIGPINPHNPNAIITEGYEIRSLGEILESFNAELTRDEYERFIKMEGDKRDQLRAFLNSVPIQRRNVDVIRALRREIIDSQYDVQFLDKTFKNDKDLSWVRDIRPLFIHTPDPRYVR